MDKVLNKRLDVSNEVAYIDIKIAYGELYIEKGENFSVEIECTQRHEIFAEVKGNYLYIWSESVKKQMHLTQKHTDHLEVKLIIPEDFCLEKVHVKTAAGVVDIESLITKCFIAKVGAGEIQIRNLEVMHFAQIENGAGTMSVENGRINNLDIDLGVGEVSICAAITGDSKINAGIGKLNLELLGNPEDYSLIVKKGLGSCFVDRLNYVSRNTYGDGANHIKVNGGIGEINVSFSEN